MELPFTHAQFLDAFGAYNRTLWPGVLALWVVSVVFVLGWLLRRRTGHRALSGLLAAHWVWSAIAYHLAFFASVNPAAPVFAILFVAEAVLLFWFGVVRSRLVFTVGRSFRHVLAVALILYALVYPLLNLALGYQFPRSPTFGVPCPSTLLTAGLLLAVAPAPPWTVLAIPILWTIIGGSAALLLDVHADLALILAGVALLVYGVVGRPRRPATAA
ncbi:MAG: DUF6064 family protein [Gemmatimonadales bacterium]|jgi:hypothetical protein